MIVGPATDVLYRMVATIPDIFAAAIIVGIAFDALPDKFGLGQACSGRPHSLR
ncbi:MAG: hypothetical protein R3B95_07115 [Nitrospirales bacterium]|nr:hypothetical protein [Nitrospira sp.]MDR4482990.1 hypothetical protein [Nitrospirales bacterium]